MPMYRLTNRFWDGVQRHPVGSVLEFPSGGAPKSAVEVEEAEEAEAPKPATKTK